MIMFGQTHLVIRGAPYKRNDLQNDAEIDVHTFRIGDFFVYATFDYAGKHARVTLGDMWQQRHNDYGDGYSNIIIHPDGRITTNWK